MSSKCVTMSTVRLFFNQFSKMFLNQTNFQMKLAIHNYFRTFGTVVSVEVRSKDEHLYGFIRFKNEDDATAVLLKPWHLIKIRVLMVRPADQWDQLEHPLLIPPDQDSDSLDVLIDDCLQKVFTFLTVNDLANVAQTCVRFNQQAKQTFASKFKHFVLSTKRKFLADRSHLFMDFGSLLQSLEISDCRLDESLLKIISRECVQLKALSLRNISGDWEDWIVEPWPFTKLEEIKMENINTFNGDYLDDLWCPIWKHCLALKKLHLKDCCLVYGQINQKFPKLEEVYISESSFKKGDLKSFIMMNDTVLKLSIEKLNRRFRSSIVLDTIGETMKNLQFLEFHPKIDDLEDFDTYAQQLTNLSSLTVLKLNFNGLSIAPLTQALASKQIPIEHFAIRSGKIDENGIKSVTQLERLTVLELYKASNLTNEHLIAIAKGLPKIREFHLQGGGSNLNIIGCKKMLAHAKQLSLLTLKSIYTIEIDDDDYKAILKSVLNRPERVRLSIEIRSNGNKVRVCDKVLQENRDTFYIDEQIEDRYNDAVSVDSDSDDSYSYDSDSDDQDFIYYNDDDDEYYEIDYDS